MAAAAQCFGLYDEDKIVGFYGVLHQPHGKNKKLKRGTRLVILPDYQGIGLGYKFSTMVAKYYTQLGYDFCAVTSAKNLIIKRLESGEWILKNITTSNGTSNKNAIDYKRKSARKKNKTARFIMRANNGKSTKSDSAST